jgi:hypothetical protein
MRETLAVITPSKIAVDRAIPETSSGVSISVMTIACGIIAAGSYAWFGLAETASR